MSKIISIATAVPEYKHQQDDLLLFADKTYCKNETESRKLKFLYHQSGIESRYSVIPDYTSSSVGRQFFPDTVDLEPFPDLEKRMKWFNDHAASISMQAINECIEGKIKKEEITHLITVSCTGLSAPGLDLELMDSMGLPQNIFRTSVNFMGCYAAVHALKLADSFCKTVENANVIIVCTELCTLHFQKNISQDNITSSLLFGDGSAAILVQGNDRKEKGIYIDHFFSDVSFKGKKDMAWELSSKGFLMTLTGYVPALIREDFKGLVIKAMNSAGKNISDITHWCIHPGGRKILESIASSLQIDHAELKHSYDVLREYGNMSSPTILFVLKKLMDEFMLKPPKKPVLVFGAAFGPGLTMETFTATYV